MDLLCKIKIWFTHVILLDYHERSEEIVVKTRNKSRRSNIEITGTYPFSVRKEAEQEENASVFFNVNVKTGDERHHDPIIIRVSV